MPNNGTSTPIIDERRFILATRDTGYRSTAAAIAELVDNAVQAGASIIRIFVSQEGVGSEREISVGVLDNGSGMDAQTLRTAMQFAGSSRFNDRTGLGRFGMGLPNSSVSQARRVDVYSWEKRDRVLHSYLDVDEISDGQLVAIPRPRLAELPDWADKYARKRSGTLVHWTRCDRLDNRRARTIVEKLQRPLGQRFRYFLWAGNKIYVNDAPVVPFDPLHLSVEGGMPVAKSFGDVLPFEFRVPADPSRTSTVRVRFTELPIAECHALPVESKRQFGIVKGAGVSLVRANREIDFGWYFMGGKRKENYDDWWRCEIAFDPELDELFGVTHSKQEINPTDLLRAELSQHLEAIAQTLNSRARSAFALVRKQEPRSASPAEAKAAERDRFLPASNPHDGVDKRRLTTSSDRTNGKEPAKQEFRIRSEVLNCPDLYTWKTTKNLIAITLNQNHAFYDQVFARVNDHECPQARHGFECFLLALVRAEMAITDEMTLNAVRKFRQSFGNILAAYLGD